MALYNRTLPKAAAIGEQFGIAAIYDDPEMLLQNEKIDFIDIITDVDTHSQFVNLAAEYRVPAICQKPMAPTLAIAEQMVSVCREADVPMMIHENWRWQHQIRQLKRTLDRADVGRPFRAHIHYTNSFPVFDNQPFLKELDQFILADIGSHILDTARFLFGDAKSVYCQIASITPGIKGEDVATVMMEMGPGISVVCSMSYASPVEQNRFPETYVHVECERGAVELAPDFWIRATTEAGTLARRFPPPRYSWADPAYDAVHASIVACNSDLLHALRTGQPAETSAEDNLKTMQLVFAAYDSASDGRVVQL